MQHFICHITTFVLANCVKGMICSFAIYEIISVHNSYNHKSWVTDVCINLIWFSRLRFFFFQVWFQNRRSKERRMKQLSALGARRHFFRNPRRMRALRAGMSPNDLDDGDMMAGPGFGYFSGNSSMANLIFDCRIRRKKTSLISDCRIRQKTSI